MVEANLTSCGTVITMGSSGMSAALAVRLSAFMYNRITFEAGNTKIHIPRDAGAKMN